MLDKITKKKPFKYTQPEAEPKFSALYQRHIALAAKAQIVPFAGYLMPLWYSSISAEHNAVRTTAGLFDCTHMGVLEIAGSGAEQFLNTITVNNVSVLATGQAQYSYILDYAGNVLDDIIIYRRANGLFMLVVNAANELKIKTWLGTMQNAPLIKDLKDPDDSGDDAKVDLAIQGPASIEYLEKLTTADLKKLKPFTFLETRIAGIDAIISNSGYTGAKVGFELFVHPAKAPSLWDKLIASGAVPCGLGARDSLRIEAGLPLYGHEIAGKFNISPFELGYGWTVKLDKEFFIGKTVMQDKISTFNMQVVRVKLPGTRGIRPVRQDDALLADNGKCIGHILSCARAGENQIALAYIKKQYTNRDSSANIYYLARNQSQLQNGKKDKVQIGDILEPDINGIIVNRFEKF